MNDMQKVFDAQLAAFNHDGAPDFAERVANLERLHSLIGEWEGRICDAISRDFSANGAGGRSRHETILAETNFARMDIRYTLKHLRRWMKPKRVRTPLHLLPSHSEIRKQALGVVGVVSPWNYPFQLAIVPVTAALAAGNRVMLKPSEHTPETAALLAEMLAPFGPETLHVVTGGPEVAAQFSALPFHHLFFTGSTAVGRIVAQAAARNLTPVTLELGGKSPAVVDAGADLSRSAERLVAGKLLNAGQTCVAPDYILAPRADIRPLADALLAAAERFYPRFADNPDYTGIISDARFAYLQALVNDARAKGAEVLVAGHDGDNALAATRKIPLTLVLNPTPDMQILQEEIFGPILPILPADTPSEAIDYINRHDRPLALYWFGEDAEHREQILSRTLSGGVCVNDVLFQLAQENLPFGGVGASGMGAYHGDYGFRSFSHERAVFFQRKFSAAKMLQPPYGKNWDRAVALMKRLG